MTTVFLAGIIQGSLNDTIHAQDYREHLKAAVRRALPQADIYCPIEHHPQSLAFPDHHARTVFFDLMRRAGEATVLIAYLPEASMGTAIEMWNAYHAGHVVLAISPMRANWVVKFLADHLFDDVETLAAFLATEEFRQLLVRKTGTAPPR